jgi:hypothetical protein
MGSPDLQKFATAHPKNLGTARYFYNLAPTALYSYRARYTYTAFSECFFAYFLTFLLVSFGDYIVFNLG